MNGETFLQIFGDIDEKYIGQADDDDGDYIEDACDGVAVRVDVSRRFSWRTIITSIACTAAVLFGVLALLLNIGKIGIIDDPASSVSEPDNSSNSRSNAVIPDFLFEEAAYAYEKDSNELKHFEIGDKFGEKAEILSAKATYKLTYRTPIIQKQEITLAIRFFAEYNSSVYVEDDYMSALAAIRYGLDEFDLPGFGEDFEIEPFMFNITIENQQSAIQITRLEITVDYETKTVHLHTDTGFITTF